MKENCLHWCALGSLAGIFVRQSLAWTGTKCVQAMLAKKFLLTYDLSERKTSGYHSVSSGKVMDVTNLWQEFSAHLLIPFEKKNGRICFRFWFYLRDSAVSWSI